MEAASSPPIVDVTETARDRLRHSPYVPLRSLCCDFESGGLVLRGRLPNFHHKQLAQETVRRLAGVRQIINEIEVID